MNKPNPAAASVIAMALTLCGAGALSGCAATTANANATIEPVADNSRSEMKNASSERALSANQSPDWSGSTSGIDARRSSQEIVADAVAAPAGRPIGLYGERISDAARSSQQPQGRGNLAQVSFIEEGASFDPAIDRSGRRLAFASTMHRSGADIYIKTIGSSTITQLTSDPADDVMPAFNPAGDKIAFASNRAGRWDIYVMSVDGGPAVQVTNDHDHEIHPSWSPDGRKIVYCKFNSQSSRWEIWVVDVKNPGVRRFLEYGMFPKWSPDVASSKILFQRPRQRGSRLHGIWTIDYVNGEATHPTEIVSAANAATINPSWSPDGRRIAFVTVLNPDDSAASDVPEQADLWVVNIDGSGRTRLTDGQFANYQPVWADGHLYFVSNRSGTDNIWAVPTDRIIDLRTPATEVAGAPTERE